MNNTKDIFQADEQLYPYTTITKDWLGKNEYKTYA